MVALIVGLADAALYADQPTQPNNAFRLALGRQAGSILAYQVVATNVVGFPFQPDPTVDLRHYVFAQPVVEEVLRDLRRIEENKGLWSIDFPMGEDGASIFDLVMVSIDHTDIKQIEDDVKRGRALRAKFARLNQKPNGKSNDNYPGNLFGQPNYETPFASLAAVINPDKAACPVIVVRLAVVRDGANLVKELIKVPQKRSLPASPKQLPGPNHKQSNTRPNQANRPFRQQNSAKRPKKGEDNEQHTS